MNTTGAIIEQVLLQMHKLNVIVQQKVDIINVNILQCVTVNIIRTQLQVFHILILVDMVIATRTAYLRSMKRCHRSL